MKKKIVYIITAAIALTAFFIGRNTAQTPTSKGGYTMTAKEKDYCLDLLLEGLRYAKESQEDFKKVSDKTLSDTKRQIAELQGQNHLGCAQGIYQALVTLKYNHKQMAVLSKML